MEKTHGVQIAAIALTIAANYAFVAYLTVLSVFYEPVSLREIIGAALLTVNSFFLWAILESLRAKRQRAN